MSFPSGDAPSASLGCCAIAIALLRTTKKVLGRTEGCHPERSEGSRFRSAIPNNCRVKTEILPAEKHAVRMTNKGNPVRSGRRVVILSAAKDPAFGLPFRTTAESKPRSFGRKNSPQDDKSPKLRSQDDKKRKNSPQDDKIPGHWSQDNRQRHLRGVGNLALWP